MKKKFICTNFAQCNSADSGEIFEIEDYLATKCPTCKNTTLEEYEPPRGFCTRFKKVCMFGGGGLSLVMASYLIFGGVTPEQITPCNNNQIKIYKDDKVIGCEDCNTNQYIDGNKCVDNSVTPVVEPNSTTVNTSVVSSTQEGTPQQIVPPVISNKPKPEVVVPIVDKPIYNEEQPKVVEPKTKVCKSNQIKIYRNGKIVECENCANNQHIINNKCVNNEPEKSTCTKNQYIVNNKCVDNKIICTKNQHIVNNKCVDNVDSTKLYTLRITTNPSNADISGVTNGAKLKEGSYTITVSKKGYESKRVTINLNSNKHINVSLNPNDNTGRDTHSHTPVIYTQSEDTSHCGGDISKIRSLISSGQRMEASSLKMRLMASGKCSDSEEEIIDNLRP